MHLPQITTLRNSSNFEIPFARLCSYDFFPSTLKLWNEILLYIRSSVYQFKVNVHAVQSLDLKFTGVVQIRCTSGEVGVQN